MLQCYFYWLNFRLDLDFASFSTTPFSVQGSHPHTTLRLLCHVSPVFSGLWQFLCFLVFYDLESLEESWPRVYLLFKSLKLILMGTAVRNSFLYRCLSLHFVLHIFFPRVLKGFIKILYCLFLHVGDIITEDYFHSLNICSCHTCTYSVPCTVLGDGHISMKDAEKNPCVHTAYILVQKTGSNWLR